MTPTWKGVRRFVGIVGPALTLATSFSAAARAEDRVPSRLSGAAPTMVATQAGRALHAAATSGATTKVTSSPAPPSLTPLGSGVEPAHTESELADAEQPSPAERFPHNGFVTDIRIGTQGCFRAVCAGESHRAVPGFRVDGFIGGNILGWIELGFSGGWGTMGADVDRGTNVLDLYGIDSDQLIDLTQRLGRPLGFSIGSLSIREVRLRMARVGPALRVHFIPRGRVAVYVGSGIGWSLFRAQYDTIGGRMLLDFHGIDVPVQAGFAVHVTPNIALGLQADYVWTHYLAVSLEHPNQDLLLPVNILSDAVATQGMNLRTALPQYWTVAAMLRARI